MNTRPARHATSVAGAEPANPSTPDGAGVSAIGSAARQSPQLRGLRAVEILARQPQTAAGLARLLGINRSTSLRLLQELEAAGYVARDPESKVYAPRTPWLWGMVASTTDHVDVSEILGPILSRLRDEFGEAMAFAVPVKGAMVYVLYFPSGHQIALREQLGTVRPMHCSALGKAYLSAQDPASLDIELGRLDYSGGTAKAAHGPMELRSRLMIAAEQGYAIDAGETFDGSACVAVSVRLRGSLIGAVGCQGPASRLDEQLLRKIGERIKEEVQLDA